MHEQVDAGVERRAADLRALHVHRREHAGEEHRQLRILPAAEGEVQIVDAEDGQGKGKRRIDRHAHRHGLGLGGGAIADHAIGALLDEVAKAVVRLLVHHPIAGSRRGPALVEAGAVDDEVAERHLLFHEQVAPRDHHDLAGRQPLEQEERVPVDRSDRPVTLDFVVGDDRRGEVGLDGLHLDLGKRAAVDPDGAAIERLLRVHRIELHDVAVEAVRALDPVEPVAVVRLRSATAAAATGPSRPGGAETAAGSVPSASR